MWIVCKNNELMHYGVVGMKWGVRNRRKYQSDDGQLTERGKKRFGSYEQLAKNKRQGFKEEAEYWREELKNDKKAYEQDKKAGRINDDYDSHYKEFRDYIKDRIKTAEKLAKTYGPEDAKTFVKNTTEREGREAVDKAMGKIGTVSVAGLVALAVVPAALAKAQKRG